MKIYDDNILIIQSKKQERKKANIIDKIDNTFI